VVSVGGTYRLNEKTTLQAQLATSNYDVNTFSEKDKSNNKGYAAKFTISHNTSWKTKRDKMLLLNTIADYEWVNKKIFSARRKASPRRVCARLGIACIN